MLSSAILALSLLSPALSMPLTGIQSSDSDAQALLENGDASVVTRTHTVTAFAVETATTTITPSPTTTQADPDSTVLFLPPDASLSFVSPTPSPSTTSANITTEAAHPLVMAYYPDWVGDMYPPEKVDFSRIDWIDFAFAVPDANCNLGWDGAEATAPGLLQRLVAAAHAKGKKVKLSVGGWTGSKYFSPAVSNDQNRHTLVNNIVAMYKQFQLDGIDIDWEYPGQPGNDGNAVSSVDTTNFLSFLTLLRSQLPPTARISAAAQTVPFAGPDGQPVRDVSPFVNVLDWVLLMNYDVWGSSDMPGPNAPLSNACHNSTQPGASADAAINAWTAAGFPPQKLVLGVPSYGYVSRSAATRLRQRRSSPLAARSPDDPTTSDPSDPSTPDPSDPSTPNPSDPSTSDPSDPSTSDSTDPPIPNANTSTPPTPDADTKIVTLNPASGQIQYRDLLAQGALCAGGARGCGGFTRYWDACSSTPFLRSARAGQVVAYDDAQSLALKAQLARARGLRGVNMFDVAGDTDAGQLVDALRRGLGLQQ